MDTESDKFDVIYNKIHEGSSYILTCIIWLTVCNTFYDNDTHTTASKLNNIVSNVRNEGEEIDKDAAEILLG